MLTIFRVLKISCFTLVLFAYSCKNNSSPNDTRHTNSLINETSPYLLQHAYNPVDWRPWSDAVLEEATKTNKLIVVSIGYSSCHWCHVMEKETFTDKTVAASMNEHFINIKVDREERPDLDHIYMTAVQLMQGNGGWPLNIILLPNGKPIYGGTYHTNEQWKEVLHKITNLYQTSPDQLHEYASKISSGIRATNIIEPSKNIQNFSIATLDQSVKNWQKNWDLKWGGNLEKQKFIKPHSLDFLMDYAVLTNDNKTRKHVENTLDKIASGGIYDHIGGGFFRYSTDPYWKVPHFEKMLYTNAQLISLYAKAYKMYKKPRYKTIVIETIDFLEREMKSKNGGYHSAIDADSEGKEGGYYQWSKKEIQLLLKEDYVLFSKYYTLEPSDPNKKSTDFILSQSSNDSIFISQNDISTQHLTTLKTKWRELLLTERQKRTSPDSDDKIITSWNALLINGFIDAYKAIGNIEYLNKAIALSDAIQKNNTKDSFLVHTYKKNDQQQEGFLEDYAFLIDAYITMYSTTLETSYLDHANTLQTTVTTHFTDSVSGMYTYTREQKLIATLIKVDDGVIPSPNAIMGHNLKRLGIINYNPQFTKKSKLMLSSMMSYITDSAKDFSKWNMLQLHTVYPFYEIVIVGENAATIATTFNSYYIPNSIVVASTQKSALPVFKDKYIEDETFIYICQEGSCKLPVQSIEEALKQL
ncbi:thioredoxin domain-containing protein [Aquimarina longa]|uniref:thioredoxin domain-containing protein n=1 Tax=Aquimarina longa TaxID=1080221 RepID=UPI000780BBBE|nr:thioredoxin domain-containing protein [Aquimarina longa]